MVLRMKNFDILGVRWKIQLFFWGGGVGVGVTKKYREELLKRRLRQFSDLRGAWQEIEGVRFLRGDWYPNALYDNLESVS